MTELDRAERGSELQNILRSKAALNAIYCDVYRRYAAVLAKSPARGVALEIGAGAGFAKDVLPEVTTTDILPYANLDFVLDATNLPFREGSLRAIFMLNVFHHIPNVEAFLDEADRCLMRGGRMLIVDQYPGWISTPILRWLHHEPFCPHAESWKFASTGPLSGANGALSWIVFERDRRRFQSLWPHLQIEAFKPHSPLAYWLAGGLKHWSLLPGPAFPLARRFDALLIKLSRRLGSMVDVELVKTTT